jgi:hypothetical protein
MSASTQNYSSRLGCQYVGLSPQLPRCRTRGRAAPSRASLPTVGQKNRRPPALRSHSVQSGRMATMASTSCSSSAPGACSRSASGGRRLGTYCCARAACKVAMVSTPPDGSLQGIPMPGSGGWRTSRQKVQPATGPGQSGSEPGSVPGTQNRASAPKEPDSSTQPSLFDP